MKNRIKLLIILAFLFVLIGLVFYSSNKIKKADVKVETNSYKNATYLIGGEKVTLNEGISKVITAPGSASFVTTTYFGNEVSADFDTDGRQDTAFLLTQNTGGSGTFYYLVVALNKEDGFVGSEAIFLGDRIAPQTTELKENNIIVVNYAERKPGESFAEQPSVGKSIWLKFDPKTMQLGEVVQDFEGEADYVTYKNTKYKFSIMFPRSFAVDEKYKYELSPVKSFPGVKFTIPKVLYEGTNLSADSYLSVEMAQTGNSVCNSQIFLDSSEIKGFSEFNKHKYTIAYSMGAGAGNRYEETVYATPVENGCLGIRYFVHYGVYENYPEGSIKEFDMKAITSIFDTIRLSIKIEK